MVNDECIDMMYHPTYKHDFFNKSSTKLNTESEEDKMNSNQRCHNNEDEWSQNDNRTNHNRQSNSVSLSPYAAKRCLMEAPLPSNMLSAIKISRTEESYSQLFVRHTDYIIEYFEAGGFTATPRRYKEFCSLHSELQQIDTSLGLPQLPAKKFFGNLDPVFVETRRRALEMYLLQLAQNVKVIASDEFWSFLNASKTTVVVSRFITTKYDVEVQLRRLYELLQNSYPLSSLNESNCVTAISEPRIIQRIADIGMSGSVKSKIRVALILQALLVNDDSREYMSTSNAFAVGIFMVESVTQSVEYACPVSNLHLLDVAREFCYRFVDTCPLVMGVYFRKYEGLQQLLSLLKTEVFAAEIHSFVSLLLWSSIHLQDVQRALADCDGTGMLVLAELYHSPSCNARIACGLILSMLLVSKQFKSSDIIEKAALSVEQLPKCIQDSSCMKARTTIQPQSCRSSIFKDDTNGDLRNVEVSNEYPTTMRTQSLSDVITNASIVHNYNNKNSEKLALDDDGQFGLSEQRHPLCDSDGLDFFFIYVLWRGRGQNHFRDLLSSAEDGSLPQVTFFALWCLVILVTRSRHHHKPTPYISDDNFLDRKALPPDTIDSPNIMPSEIQDRHSSVDDNNLLTSAGVLLSPSSGKNVVNVFPGDVNSLMAAAVQRRLDGEDIGNCNYYTHDSIHTSPQDVHTHTHTILYPTRQNSYLYSDLTYQADRYCSLMATQRQDSNSITYPSIDGDNEIQRIQRNECNTSFHEEKPHLILEDPGLCLIRTGVSTIVASLVISKCPAIKYMASALLINIPWADKTLATIHPQLQAIGLTSESYLSPRTVCGTITDDNIDEFTTENKFVPLDKGSNVRDMCVRPHPSSMGVVTPPTSTRSATSILEPPVYAIPQKLLKERVVISHALIEYIDSQISIARELLSSETERLKAKEEIVALRQTHLHIDESKIIDFMSGLRLYIKVREKLTEVPTIARLFLTQMKVRPESQSMCREVLFAQSTDFVQDLDNLRQMSADIELCYADAVNKETTMIKRRGEAETNWQKLVESNGNLRELQSDLRAVKQFSARLRMQWMEIEQAIVDAPRKKQQLAEQIVIKEAEIKNVDAKCRSTKSEILHHQNELLRVDTNLKDLGNSISVVNEIKHSFADWMNAQSVAASTSDSLTRRTLESHIIDADEMKPPLSTKSEGLHDDIKPEQQKVRYYSADGRRRINMRTSINCREDIEHGLKKNGYTRMSYDRENCSTDLTTNSLKGVSTESDADQALSVVAKVRSLYARLPSECRNGKTLNDLLHNGVDTNECITVFREILGDCDNLLKAKHENANSETHHRSIRHLAEKQKRHEAKYKKHEAEVRHLKVQLDIQTNPEILMKKSEELQTLVRQKDIEVEKKSSELLEIHHCSKDIEQQLEKKKKEMRQKESEFSTSREILAQLVDACNNSRKKLCMKLLAHETQHKPLLADVACSREDALYMSTNRYALDLLLLNEKKVRLQFRSKIADLISALKETDDALSEIDDAPLADLDSVAQAFCCRMFQTGHTGTHKSFRMEWCK